MGDVGGWSTIESDEGVFTSLIETLGVQNVQFEELISLDADTIRSLGSVYGVIFLFKWTREAAGARAEAPIDGTYDETAAENNVFFAAQTIQNACGTQAILSVILNHDNPPKPLPAIPLGTELASFKDFTTGFPPELRGEALSNSEAIRTAHNTFAKSQYPPEETHFNLMAVVQDPRPRAREIGDAETLEREERKRAAWQWENTLRRWNFVGFIGEMMKGVAGAKERDGKYDEWVDAAKAETRKKIESRRGA
ncbi:hypothetical protein N7509_011027 [Penicillium cosmopolitanum]|uniref:ubiquitinyl hydrolase 1 n=1 Tax=Penicillium cosmopolitanum TaxID=1131564 RepID=A0A9W9VSF3_9EURO|nr:uncharacterized protein N7509_011027 [Penicillium cosmopolitanum]KAJ5388486.1 hypothetical protein N7509_011027 [Penicillium cosmopolitanum]